MSATVSIPGAGHWLRTLISGKPHQVITNDLGEPYLKRWYVIPRNGHLNVYVHRFTASDQPPIHDHPWDYASLVLSGAYTEHTETGTHRRRPGSFGRRAATHRHQIVLDRDTDGRERPCTTIIVTGPRRRIWGFWCSPTQFVAWDSFSGGCGEVQ